ncbi:hypothetical protein R1flu_026512 [Riccia fluitans]|uniref:Uncharacterized protein n=1 Tax=Riccia fluitans TaxID=41844 RepID=A0ABD1XG52_9MARC
MAASNSRFLRLVSEEEIYDDSDDEEINDEDDEEVVFEESLQALRAGKLLVKNTEDTTLRCPYSPDRKKQNYKYKDLLQHAVAVGKGNRSSLEVGRHLALAAYLRTDLASMAPPPTERAYKFVLPVPKDEDWKDMLLFPWTGLVYNIPTKANEDGFKVGPSNAELKFIFKEFLPEKAEAVWEENQHTGLGVVTFQKDFDGWKCAQAFEKWFSRNERGKKEWKNGTRLDSELYGWLARKEDYEGLGDQDVMAKFLQKRGPLQLKEIAMTMEEVMSMCEERLDFLSASVNQRKLEFETMMEAVQAIRLRYEKMTRELEEHKQGTNEQKLEEVETQTVIQDNEKAIEFGGSGVAMAPRDHIPAEVWNEVLGDEGKDNFLPAELFEIVLGAADLWENSLGEKDIDTFPELRDAKESAGIERSAQNDLSGMVYMSKEESLQFYSKKLLEPVMIKKPQEKGKPVKSEDETNQLTLLKGKEKMAESSNQAEESDEHRVGEICDAQSWDAETPEDPVLILERLFLADRYSHSEIHMEEKGSTEKLAQMGSQENSLEFSPMELSEPLNEPEEKEDPAKSEDETNQLTLQETKIEEMKLSAACVLTLWSILNLFARVCDWLAGLSMNEETREAAVGALELGEVVDNHESRTESSIYEFCESEICAVADTHESRTDGTELTIDEMQQELQATVVCFFVHQVTGLLPRITGHPRRGGLKQCLHSRS